MSNSLINSAPLIIGIDDPKERRSLASYVFRASRALIGDEMADSLGYPHVARRPAFSGCSGCSSATID